MGGARAGGSRPALKSDGSDRTPPAMRRESSGSIEAAAALSPGEVFAAAIWWQTEHSLEASSLCGGAQVKPISVETCSPQHSWS